MNIKQILIYAVISFCILFAVVSCKKETSPYENRHSLSCRNNVVASITNPQLVKCKYKPGSYWLMLDSAAHHTDTLKVTAQATRFGAILSSATCDTLEINELTIENIYPGPSRFRLMVVPDRITLSDNANPYYAVFAPQKITYLYELPYKVLDSLFVYDRWYKNIYVSDTLNIGPPYGPNGQLLSRDALKLKCYFNADYGFLRNDFFNVNGVLLSRKVVTSRQIIL